MAETEDPQQKIKELESKVQSLLGHIDAYDRLKPYGFNTRQARLLVFLATGAPRAFDKSAIATAVDYKNSPNSKGVEVLICKTRRIVRKISGGNKIIETVYGLGYRANNDLAKWVLSKTRMETNEQPGENTAGASPSNGLHEGPSGEDHAEGNTPGAGRVPCAGGAEASGTGSTPHGGVGEEPSPCGGEGTTAGTVGTSSGDPALSGQGAD